MDLINSVVRALEAAGQPEAAIRAADAMLDLLNFRTWVETGSTKAARR